MKGGKKERPLLMKERPRECEDKIGWKYLAKTSSSMSKLCGIDILKIKQKKVRGKGNRTEQFQDPTDIDFWAIELKIYM